MDLSKVLGDIKKTFIVRKKIDFDELNFHFELEPLSAADEAKVVEACKTLDGAGYIMALKRQSLALAIKKINDTELGGVESVDYTDEDGKIKSKSKFLYLLDFINDWPMSLVDQIFDVLNNLHAEIEDRVKSKSRFEKFVSKIVEDTKKKDDDSELSELDKDEDIIDEDENDVDRLNRTVAKEIEDADAEIARTAP